MALGVVAAACGLVAALFVAVYSGSGGGEIRRGVEAGGVKLGGMTEREAREAVAGRAAASLGRIDLANGEKKRLSIPGEKLGIQVDAAGAAREAYRVGRRGGLPERLSEFAGSYLGGEVEIPVEISYDEGAAREALAELARGFNREPEDAVPAVGDDGKVEIRGGEEGLDLDQQATLVRLDRALADLEGDVVLVAKTDEPDVTREEAQAQAPTRLVGEYRTDFEWDPDEARQANLKKASGAIDNTLLAPGEVFSTNELLSPLDYEEAKVFADGGVAKEAGGGLCQVSSTLYMAANYAGLEIVERSPHYALLPYIPPGFDATVWFGGEGVQPLDLKFKNTTGGYVTIREFVDDEGFLTAQVYAQKPTGKSVMMNAEKVEEDLRKGITWATSKKVIARDGEVLSDEVLYEDTYSYNPPVPEGMQGETNAPRTGGWADPTNTTGWADVN